MTAKRSAELNPTQRRAARSVLLTVAEAEPGIYTVSGGSTPRTVTVNHLTSCDCPDHQFRGSRCAHILAVAFHRGQAA